MEYFRSLKLSCSDSFKALKLSILVEEEEKNLSIITEGLGCLFIFTWFMVAAWISVRLIIRCLIF